EAAHRKAQASPNSLGSPTRPAGVAAPRFASCSSNEMFSRRASYSMPERSRSVRNGPGNSPLIVTLYLATCRASPAQKAVSPARAPLLMPRLGIGDFTEPEVMLTMRPNLRSHMPSTVALISMIGVSMLALTAFCQSSTDHSRKSPCGGPPQLVARISGLGQAASAAARPASVEISPGTAVTLAPVSLRISSAVCSRVSAVRAVIVSSTPARPSDIAQARPNPLLAAQTKALRPRMRKSNMSSSALSNNHSPYLKMTLTLILDPAPVGVRASLIEEWEELGRTARMEPMVRLFESREQAIVWARAFASRRGSKQIFLTDNRKLPRE